MELINYYCKTYIGYASDFWTNLTPSQYGIVLIVIAVIGYLSMRSQR